MAFQRRKEGFNSLKKKTPGKEHLRRERRTRRAKKGNLTPGWTQRQALFKTARKEESRQARSNTFVEKKKEEGFCPAFKDEGTNEKEGTKVLRGPP